MNASKDDKNFDELIAKAIGRDRPKFDFDKWKQTYRKEIDIFESQEEPPKTNPASFKSNIHRTIFLSKVGYLAAALLVIFSWAAFFTMSGKVEELKKELEQSRRDIALAPADNSATINFYLKEHQDVIARNASIDTSTPSAQMRVGQHDILYYEVFDNQPEFMRPGIIVRGPFSEREIDSSRTPVISDGHTLPLTEARQAAGFDLVSPSWLHPGYSLDQIRRIKGRDTLQLLYSDGINSLSLFEQPLDGQRGLSQQDFREYAVYRNKGQAGGTILVWRDNALFYVLIGNTEMSLLMNMAQSISDGK